ncbi:MAG: hypothetical protein EOP87_08810, partial [Verrucomicrobiaceae bacterium]
DMLSPITQYSSSKNLFRIRRFLGGGMVFDTTRGFPKTRDELFSYDVVICGDVPRGNFTKEEMQWVNDLVTRRGGGFCMIGGYTSFDSGDFDQTPWEKITPVDMVEYGHGYSNRPTELIIPESVRTHPIWRISPDSAENDEILSNHPAFYGFHDIRRAKPGAINLGLHADGGGPLITVQSYGRGRSMAFLSDTNGGWAQAYIHWGEEKSGASINGGSELGHGPQILRSAAGMTEADAVPADMVHPSPYFGQFWVNTVRWLAENSIRRLGEGISGRAADSVARPGTELAISESQERMAVCVDPSEIAYFIAEADKENLECVHVADVTGDGRLVMTWRGRTIVDLSRAFLDTNGVQQTAEIHVGAASCVSSLPERPTPSSLTDALSSLNIASQKGLGERFDGSVGAGTVLWPFGGEHQLTPPDAMVAKLPLLEGQTDVATFMSWAYDPYISSASPFHGALYAVTESVCKAVAAGARLSDVRLTLQEYFPKLGTNPSRWGLPFAALLGAFHAQHKLRLAAIGGKDSMSGSFNELDVPPTLVSFALAPGDARLALSPEFKKAGSSVSLVEVPYHEYGLPDFNALKATAKALHQLNRDGKILSMKALGSAGLSPAIAICCFGNGIGFDGEFENEFGGRHFSFLIEHQYDLPEALGAQKIGHTTAEPAFILNGASQPLAELQAAWTGKLEPIYPTKPAEASGAELPEIPLDPIFHIRNRTTAIARPQVLIPAFPGTNSEYDSAKAFNEAGAASRIIVFRNLTAKHVEESLDALAAEIRASQILFIPGGFSAGDEPDGSGKFIATVLRSPRVADAVMDLLKNRDGLILGVCNGFQALIKTGLVPYGEIRDSEPNAPTLAHNDIARHISCYAYTKVISSRSPWLAQTQPGDIHRIPLSHGEGKFHATPETLAELVANGQVATQYCDANGVPSLDPFITPNGSIAAIEGITSPCGRVFGKMGHTERSGQHVARNIPGNKHQPIFSGGVAYYA